MRKLLLAVPLVLTLGACQPHVDTVSKEKGQIVDMQIHKLKIGQAYDLIISYPKDGGKYILDTFNVGNKDKYNEYRVGQNVTVYEDEKGIRAVVK